MFGETNGGWNEIRCCSVPITGVQFVQKPSASLNSGATQTRDWQVGSTVSLLNQIIRGLSESAAKHGILIIVLFSEMCMVWHRFYTAALNISEHRQTQPAALREIWWEPDDTHRIQIALGIKRDQLDATCFIISLFNAQRVSDVNTSILRSLRLIWWVIS